MTEKKPKRGRPRINIDLKDAEKLASLHCTGEEIAGFFDINYDTLLKIIKREYKMNFSDWYKRYSANGKISLRRKQYEVALSGNCSMLIWLGKQLLEQREQKTPIEEETTAEDLLRLSDLLRKAYKEKPENESSD